MRLDFDFQGSAGHVIVRKAFALKPAGELAFTFQIRGLARPTRSSSSSSIRRARTSGGASSWTSSSPRAAADHGPEVRVSSSRGARAAVARRSASATSSSRSRRARAGRDRSGSTSCASRSGRRMSVSISSRRSRRRPSRTDTSRGSSSIRTADELAQRGARRRAVAAHRFPAPARVRRADHRLGPRGLRQRVPGPGLGRRRELDARLRQRDRQRQSRLHLHARRRVRYIRLELMQSSRRQGYEIRGIAVKPVSFSTSRTISSRRSPPMRCRAAIRSTCSTGRPIGRSSA